MLKEISEYRIGNTPLFEIGMNDGNKIHIKLEKYNFLRSIKARTAYYIVKNLPELDKRCIVESTSGNLGLALNYFLKEENIEFLCLVDESISKEKLLKLEEHGVHYKIVSQYEDMDLRSSRIKMAKDLEETGQYYWTNQYANMNNMLANYSSTAPEIWNQRDGNVDACICPVGSGGTVSGIAKYMKEKNSNIHILGVEPVGSTIFGGEDGEYINAGTGLKGPSQLIEKHMSYIDGYYQIPDKESIFYCKELKDKYDLKLGISSGMAYAAAVKYAKKVKNQNIIVISPDGMESYQHIFAD
ncbi:pyridoxal-phosphate dependent enzyme [Anaerocolumna sp. AGMB13020]|uniref:pyridoxal-phosphate dependent enzyme n=1 Tax=Anaerocolumna sp. AGMB13020 TaxID=3081750 RepID=UPI002955B1A9|nr:pyridoxal-phosphate dependent enzyme [Anaerocolumna sp. AGMB13020]WOO36837.1 pyridoxal-phosphate dependent enzyme [Anaerocolumna sp. AGMB13020]